MQTITVIAAKKKKKRRGEGGDMAPDGAKADPASHYRLIKAQRRMEILG